MALDNYFDTDTALKYVKLAEKKLPSSFTVAMIGKLIASMEKEDKAWENVKKVL